MPLWFIPARAWLTGLTPHVKTRRAAPKMAVLAIAKIPITFLLTFALLQE
jgi:hypothetical protein